MTVMEKGEIIDEYDKFLDSIFPNGGGPRIDYEYTTWKIIMLMWVDLQMAEEKIRQLGNDVLALEQK